MRLTTITRNTATIVIAVLIEITLLAPLANAQEAADAKVPLFDGLGTYGRQVTTASGEAQRYVNQGLCFLYAFNYDEAIRSFRRAADIDAECAMAWWGISVANGPHINNPTVTEPRAKAAWSALLKAREAETNASEVERAMIDALGKRYADPQPADRKLLDLAYAEAMRKLWKTYPNDADIGALFAESLMDLRPWDLWTHDGRPQPGTEEIVALLETVMDKSPQHPLALHLYIHAVEASKHPERADAAANRLRDLQPGLGHLVHMPSHIDVRRGRWAQAAVANEKAIAADRAYRRLSPQQDFYRIYMAHNHHMLAYACMMRGQTRQAIAAINEMVETIPPAWIQENAAAADGFTAMPVEVLVRFGRWNEILSAPEPPEYLPLARAMRHCARGIAFAATGEVEQANAEQRAFLSAKSKVPESVRFGNNTAADILAVAQHMMAGEILYREGQIDEGIAELRVAVKLEDQLRYSEPPDWIQPVRHALGATLLHAGRAAEAEMIYREDLVLLPNNGWSLYGLSRSLYLQGKSDEARQVEAGFHQAWRDADVKITSSCYCQPVR